MNVEHKKLVTTQELIDAGSHHFSPLEQRAIRKLMKQFGRAIADEIGTTNWGYFYKDGTINEEHFELLKTNIK